MGVYMPRGPVQEKPAHETRPKAKIAWYTGDGHLPQENAKWPSA